jgi:hypothetical protein
MASFYRSHSEVKTRLGHGFEISQGKRSEVRI